MYSLETIYIILAALLVFALLGQLLDFIIDLYYKGVFLPKKRRRKVKIHKY